MGTLAYGKAQRLGGRSADHGDDVDPGRDFDRYLGAYRPLITALTVPVK